MKYVEMIQKVQNYSGFNLNESEEALQVMVESLSVRLPEPQRSRFAGQLPEFLKNIALSVMPSEQNSSQDIVRQFMLLRQIDETRAKKQIKAAWKTLQYAMGMGITKDIKRQLPKNTNYVLNF